MKYDKIISRNKYFQSLDAIKLVQEEVLRMDWSDGRKDLRDIPLVVGGMHHLEMRVVPNHKDREKLDITFRIVDEPGYPENHPDLERVSRFYNRVVPPE
ncbi:MAG: hypothetical protein ACTSU5_03640 [Promethearchaeota archaeon]